MPPHPLTRLRRILQSLMLGAFLILFLDCSGAIRYYLAWLAKLQGISAILALNLGALVFLVLLTLLFGRLYCSLLCPLGAWQDMVSLLARKINRKRRYEYTPAHNAWRYGFLALAVVSPLLGARWLSARLDPYANFGLFVTGWLRPVWTCINNLLAQVAAHYESYTLVSAETCAMALPLLLTSLALMLIVSAMACRSGRLYCNTVCPLGTLLGIMGRLALVRPQMDKDKCLNCGLCARQCKSQCIDVAGHSIDMSRCVACYNCLSVCSVKAINLHKGRPSINSAAGSYTLKNEHAQKSSTPKEP